jgi:hypothetical protein
MQDILNLLPIFSIFIAIIAFYNGKKTSEHTKELQAYVDTIRRRYVDIRHSYNVIDATTSVYTQFSFVNRGTIPATDVKIRLTYPARTKIQRIIPPIKLTESEDERYKVVELYIQRMDKDIPLAVTLLTDQAPASIMPLQFQCNEETGTQPVSPGPVSITTS